MRREPAHEHGEQRVGGGRGLAHALEHLEREPVQRLHEDARQRAPRVRHEPLADVVGEAARGDDDADREREQPGIEARLLAELRDACEQQGFDGARAARRPDARRSGSRPRAALVHDLDHPDLPG